MTRGGKILAVSAEHFFATSAVTARAECGGDARAMQIRPANANANLGLVSTICLPV